MQISSSQRSMIENKHWIQPSCIAMSRKTKKPPSHILNQYYQSFGFDRQLKTYHLISEDFTILEVCQNFDLVSVNDLFQSGRASPFAFPRSENDVSMSLLDFTIAAFCDDEADTATFLRGIAFIRHLLSCYMNPGRLINPKIFQICCAMMAFDAEVNPVFVDGIRLILRHLNENPFEPSCLSEEEGALEINIDRSKFPFATFLLYQQHHCIDTEFFTSEATSSFRENDRTMLHDLIGSRLELCLQLRGNYTYWCPSPLANFNLMHNMFGLIHTAKVSSNPTVVMCCKNRLVLLIKYEARDGLKNIAVPQSSKSRSFDHIGCVSPLQYAMTLDLHEFIEATLLEAGFTVGEARDFFDEVRCAGIPELFSGSLQYITLKQCRKEFVLNLMNGGYQYTNKDDDALIRRLCVSTGTPLISRWLFEHLIEDGNRAFAQKLITGDDRMEQAVVLNFKEDLPATKFSVFFYPLERDREKQLEWIDIRDWLVYDD